MASGRSRRFAALALAGTTLLAMTAGRDARAQDAKALDVKALGIKAQTQAPEATVPVPPSWEAG
ncbi:hypothetical protein, partial [Methylobacterium sp. WL103]|uniref:hypothetical protein n=1 Tax=Methylobacterium sp. WL103 TaxID=2603891 RepID=UPI001AEE4E00